MQTFIPLPTFAESVAVLDQKRLGKQRVETYQLISTITGLKIANKDAPSSEWTVAEVTAKGWINHPAAIMWRDNLMALFKYQHATVAEWKSRGYRDTCLEKSAFLIEKAPWHMVSSSALPWWWADERVHASHRSALLFKAPDHYSKFGWTEEPAWAYVWPHEMVSLSS